MVALWTGAASGVSAAEQADPEADRAWLTLEKALRPPVTPESWQTTRPSQDEILKFREEQGKLAGEAAEKARAFYTRYPAHAKSAEAKRKEYEMVVFSTRLGNTNLNARLEVLEAERLKDPTLSEDDRFELRSQAVQRRAMTKREDGMTAVLAEYEKGARELLKEFPKRPEAYAMLFEVASNTEESRARPLAKELADGGAPEEIKERAQALLKKLDAVGKPLDIRFTALDGREVDLSKLKGKVVLVDFWATWCGPCVAEIPNVRATYEKLHPKGFEIVGISFDQEKEALEKFVSKEKMTWPQFFDGKGWGNKYGREYGIEGIPAMWLVDKQGKLRDMNGREDLEAKVERFLAEK